MNIKVLVLATYLLPFFSVTYAATTHNVAELFPYAAQSHSKEGEVDMGWDSQIIGTRKGKLDFKKYDDLNGKCDNGSCRISGKTLAPYSLPAFNNHPFTLPVFNKKNSSAGSKCTSWNGQNIKLKDDKYKEVIAGGDCKVSISNAGDVTISETLKINGSAVLTLQPGNYWLDSLDLSGGAKLMVAPAGEVNFYVKDNVNIAISSLGSAESKVNIYHYDNNDITLSDDIVWYGDVQTKGDIKIGGSSKLYGSVQAKSLVMSGSAELYLTAGTYWFEELELTGSAKLIPLGNSLTTVYVGEEIDLEGDVQLGKDGQPLLLFVYGDDDDDDDGEADIEGSSRLYGHLYVQGDLEMGSSTKIYGAVNVVNLDMESSSLIDYRELNITNVTKVDHYELHFNTCSEYLTVKACTDNLCNDLYQDKAKLHVKANGSNLVNFNNFIGTESKHIKSNKLNYPFTMVVQSGGQGGNMDPDAENPLVCYVDGARSCTVNKPDENANDGAFTLSVDTTYAGDHAPINITGGCLASNAIVDMEFGFESSASGFSGPVIVSWPGGSETLNAGLKKQLTLPVSGATLNYPRADLLTLSARQMLPTGGYAAKAVTEQVAFVPVSWQVQQAVDCGDDNGFFYASHAGSCTVLGAAGEPVGFSVAALDVNDNNLPLNWLKEQQGLTQLVEVNLQSSDEIQINTFGINSQDDTLSQYKLDSKLVGRLGISLPEWTAPYIPDNDNLLITKGHQAFVGRTVPASLQVTATPGDIRDDVVYAGKPGVSFEPAPSFTVVGLDINSKFLPSYSGEFAGGLKKYADLVLDTEYPIHGLEKVISESKTAGGSGTGEHIITLNTGKLEFTKDQPFPETALDLPLSLTINDHDDLEDIEGKTTTLGDENDRLRYGFVLVQDAEVKVGEVGSMSAGLNYFGSNLQTLVEDKTTLYSLKESASVHNEPELEPELVLGLDATRVIVQPYSKEQKNIRVTIQNLPNWLKPEREGSLVDPGAWLDILTQPRRRNNDRVFNRREVVR
ncbi:hypothetical protein [Oceanisphaera sp.]|uniref:hypothetical protein n=1 Tax=Oceanisphaera sp. TaxID=1929979 RepID=UPI003A918039